MSLTYEECEVSSNAGGYVVLIVYDIKSNKRRRRISKILQSYGFRFQRSVFEARITSKKLDELKVRIARTIDKNDSLKIYKLGAFSQTYEIGKAEFEKLNLEKDEHSVVVV